MKTFIQSRSLTFANGARIEKKMAKKRMNEYANRESISFMVAEKQGMYCKFDAVVEFLNPTDKID